MKLMVILLMALTLSNSLGTCDAIFGLTKESFSGNPVTRARASLEEEKKNFKTAGDFIKSIDDFYAGKGLTARKTSVVLPSTANKGYQGVLKNMEHLRKTYIDQEYKVKTTSAKGAAESPTANNGLQFDGDERSGRGNPFFELSVSDVKVQMAKINALRDIVNKEIDTIAGTQGKMKVGALVGFAEGIKKKSTTGITIARMGSTQTKLKGYAVSVVQSLIDVISITDQAKDILFDSLQNYANVMDQIVNKDLEVTRAHGEAAKRSVEKIKQGREEQMRVEAERHQAEREVQREALKAQAAEKNAEENVNAAEKREQEISKAETVRITQETEAEQVKENAELDQAARRESIERQRESLQRQNEALTTATKTKQATRDETSKLEAEARQIDLQQRSGSGYDQYSSSGSSSSYGSGSSSYDSSSGAYGGYNSGGSTYTDSSYQDQYGY
jgi:hypothetical protein